jgi:predicted small lipoprotein YifL
MKIRIIAIVGLALLSTLTGCGMQNSAPPTADPDTSLTVQPDALAVGETLLMITLADSSGQPIDGASLTIVGNMDHAGMMPVERESDQSTDGHYRVPFEWTMGGGWLVTVTAQLPDGQGEISETFEFFVEAVSSNSIINTPQPHSGN